VRASDVVGEVVELDEEVGLPAQFVGDHRRLRLDRADDAHLDTPALQRLDEPTKIAVTGHQDDMLDRAGDLHGVDGDFDVHVALELATSGALTELLQWLGNHRVAIVVEPINQRPYRRIFLLVQQRRIVIGTQQPPAARENLEQSAIIHIVTQGLGRLVEVGAVDEHAEAFIGVEVLEGRGPRHNDDSRADGCGHCRLLNADRSF
jgi:hypothetical protein